MLKITIEIKENKEKDACSVTLKNPKDLSKASEVEQKCGAMVKTNIEKALAELSAQNQN